MLINLLCAVRSAILARAWLLVFLARKIIIDTDVHRVSDPVIVIGIRFLNYSLNFMYVISDLNILFSHRSFIFDVS